jgi:hypothetical protein
VTESDFLSSVAFWRFLNAEKGNDIHGAVSTCRKTCKAIPCTNVAYTAKRVLSATNSYDQELKNFTNIWEDATNKTTKLKLTMSTGMTRVFTQMYAYEVWQLVGEVGGTWGLFLGFSAITVLDAFEKFVITCANRFCFLPK